MTGFLAGALGQNITASLGVFADNFISALKIISAFMAILSGVGLCYVFIKSAALSLKAEPVKLDKSKKDLFRRDWEKIRKRLEDVSDDNAAIIILEADALMDRALKNMGIVGLTTGDRLKALENMGFEGVQVLWDVHKFRNKIAHEGAMGIRHSDAVHALHNYEPTLKKLGVI